MSQVLESDDMAWLDRLFSTAFRHVRRHYVELWLTVSGLGIVLLAWPAQQLAQMPLWGPEPAEPHELLDYAGIGALITVGVMLWAALGPFEPVRRFLNDEPIPPARVWHAMVRSVPLVAAVSTAAYCLLGNTACIALAGKRRDFALNEYVGTWLASSLITLTAAFFFMMIWEAAFRPVLREVDPLLPGDFAPDPHWLTLTRRSTIATTSVTLYTGIAVSGLVSGHESISGRMWVTVIGTLLAAATFGGVITALVSYSISTRLSDLKAALIRIGDGDFDVRVALRLGDELDEAGRVLNETAARMRRQDEELQESRARLTSVENDERRRIERDLRLDVDHRLRALGDQLTALADRVGASDDLAPVCAEVGESLDQARSEISALGNGIFPSLLESDGLGAALADAAERAGVPTVVDHANDENLSRETEAAVYFCCSEALQNVAKHAGPGATARVRVAVRQRVLRFSIVDDGAGFDGAPAGSAAGGQGLANIRDRLRAVGGDVSISSIPGAGTTVSGRLALD